MLWPAAIEQPCGRGFLYAAPGTKAPMFRLVPSGPNILLHVSEGAVLPDPAGLLQGGGRRGRFICLRNHVLGENPALSAMIAAAVARVDPLAMGPASSTTVRNEGRSGERA